MLATLTSFMNSSDIEIYLKFAEGRESSGTRKGFDSLLNIVLDDTIGHLRDPDDHYKLTRDTRHLGLVLVVCRGTAINLAPWTAWTTSQTRLFSKSIIKYCVIICR